MEKDKRESEWNDFDFSIENLYKIHTTLLNTPFNPSDRKFFYDIINPAQKNTVINQISQDEDVVRGTAIVKGIIGEWEKGKSIFVVYGSRHSTIQEQALKTLLK